MNGVPRKPSTFPLRTALLRRAGAAIERKPAIAPKSRVSGAVAETSNSSREPRLNRLGKRAPDLELGLDVPYHFVGELVGSGVSPEVQRPVSFQHRLEGCLVDRARGLVGLLVPEEG